MIARRRVAPAIAQAFVSVCLVLTVALGPTPAPTHMAYAATSLPPLTVAGLLPPPFTRNFNPFSTAYTTQLSVAKEIYEPLYIIDDVQGKGYPWLATAYAWSKDYKTLTFTIRHGVRWSDGQPFTARDVYWTLAVLGKKAATLDQIGLLTGKATGVTMPAPDQVAIHFAVGDTTRLFSLVNNTVVVPEHTWSKVKDPQNWDNPNPVGTGPFTQIANFSSQGFDVGRNPYYWQPGKPAFDTVRIIGYVSNDAQNLALASGQVDWGNTLIPNASRVYDSHSPNFHHFYDPRAGLPIMLVPNDQKYPFSLPVFRQALSMAVNRQAISQNAEYGYDPPSDATSLKGPLTSWIDPTIPNTFAEYHPDKAQALLKQAGFTLRNGQLYDPRGHPVSFNCTTATGQADWILSCQIIVQNFKALGIDASVVVRPFTAFTVYSAGPSTIDMMYIQEGGQFSPYYNYYFECDPTGPYDRARYNNPAMNRLLAAYRLTTDAQLQRRLAYQMERVWVNTMPEIPVVVIPGPADYSTAHYTGFPTPADDYAYNQPFSLPNDTLLMLTRIHPSH